jgi:hypothetical protein
MLELRWRYAPGIGSLRSISLLLVPVLTCLSPVSVSCASPMPSLCGTLCLLKNSSSLVLMRSTAERRVADRPAFLRWGICRRPMLDRFDCPPCCSPTNPLSTCPSRVCHCFISSPSSSFKIPRLSASVLLLCWLRKLIERRVAAQIGSLRSRSYTRTMSDRFYRVPCCSTGNPFR